MFGKPIAQRHFLLLQPRPLPLLALLLARLLWFLHNFLFCSSRLRLNWLCRPRNGNINGDNVRMAKTKYDSRIPGLSPRRALPSPVLLIRSGPEPRMHSRWRLVCNRMRRARALYMHAERVLLHLRVFFKFSFCLRIPISLLRLRSDFSLRSNIINIALRPLKYNICMYIRQTVPGRESNARFAPRAARTMYIACEHKYNLIGSEKRAVASRPLASHNVTYLNSISFALAYVLNAQRHS